MGFIRGIIGLTIAVALAIFASANVQPVEVFPSPVHPPITMPLYLITLGMAAFGFITGALMVWLGTMPLRFNSLRQKRAIKGLEKQLEKSDKALARPHKPLEEFFPALPINKRAKPDE